MVNTPRHPPKQIYAGALVLADATQAAAHRDLLVEDGEMRGSLLVIEADDIKAANAWVATDPYKAAGLFASVEVIEWRKVIG